MFRKLRRIGSRGSEPAPSAPATTAESETVEPSPRAIHISDVRRSPTKLPRKPGYDAQPVSLLVANAKGAADSVDFYRLLQRDKGCNEFDPTGDFDTDYLCDGYIYNVCFISPPSAPESSSAYLTLMQHVCLVFMYDASSRESWDETVAVCERMRSCCEDGVLPFLATGIAATGEGEGEPPGVSHAEAEAFATQRDCLFVKCSPATGRGICDAVGSLVELAHGARGQYTMDQEGHTQRYKRAQAFQAVFAARDAQQLKTDIMDGCDTAAKTFSKYSKYIQWDAAPPALVRRRSPVTSLASRLMSSCLPTRYQAHI